MGGGIWGWLLAWGLFWQAGVAQAVLQRQEVPYEDGSTKLAGYLVWDDALAGKRPGVLVVHEWWGLNDYARSRADQLAALGYVAFAADMYGVGHVTEHADEAKGWMSQITANVSAWQRRAALALARLQAHPMVDSQRTAAIGYCFGGATVMQMAYAGTPLKGVASFHGSLPPVPEEVATLIPRVFIAHGDADPFVPAERIEAFRKGLNRVGADWQMHLYGGARHSFTNPAADGKKNPDILHNPAADGRSWAELQQFLTEIFAR
ncbi:MAG: dienelactone hydrolase family protein [Magnetococcus sp. WYHC-3]